MRGRTWLGVLLVLTMVLGVVSSAHAQALPPGLAKKIEKDDLKFKDWEEAKWALKHMARMKAKGILKGYEDGSFRPNAPVSEVEALVMVTRMKGTETEQAAVALANQPVPIPGAERVWWAAGHINYALQGGWISPGNFEPMRQARRVWVARLMVRALVTNWQAEIEAHANDVLPFKDAGQISREDVPYVAIAYQRGWMLGYPDGEFKPNRPLTRAEMVALLDRGEGIAPGSHPYEVKGTITAIDAANRKLSLVTAAGQSVQYTVSPDALIFVEHSIDATSLADLKVGDQVKMVLNSSGVAIVITVENDRRSVHGTVAAINLQSSPRMISLTTAQAVYGTTPVTTTYSLDVDCRAYYQNAEVPLATIAVGDKVVVQTYRNVASRITITERASATTPATPAPTTGTEIRGTIIAIATTATNTTLTVRDSNGVEFVYPLAANAVLKSGEVPITVSQLHTGLNVKITVVNSTITVLQVISQ